METRVRRSGLRALFFGADGGLRSGWRMLLYLLLFTALARALGIIPSLIPAGGAQLRLMATLVAAIGAAGIMLVHVDGRSTAALGFPLHRTAVAESGVGMGIGAATLAVAVVLVAGAGGVRWVADGGTVPEYAAALIRGMAFFAVAAAVEEAVFRGYPFQVLVRWVGVSTAVVLSSVLFAWIHARNPNVTAVGLVNIALAGAWLAVAYLRTRSLWFVTAVHAGWNWTMSALLDLPVSGLVFDTPLYSAVETGEDWWTGGAFGPEAGFAATLALAASTAWLLRTRRLAPTEHMRTLRPLVDERLPAGWA